MSSNDDEPNYTEQLRFKVREVIAVHGTECDVQRDPRDYGIVRRAGFALPNNPASLEIREVVDPEDWDGELAYQLLRKQDPRGEYNLLLSNHREIGAKVIAVVNGDLFTYAHRQHAYEYTAEYSRRFQLRTLDNPYNAIERRAADFSLPANVIPDESTMTRKQRKEYIEWSAATGTSKSMTRHLLSLASKSGENRRASTSQFVPARTNAPTPGPAEQAYRDTHPGAGSKMLDYSIFIKGYGEEEEE